MASARPGTEKRSLLRQKGAFLVYEEVPGYVYFIQAEGGGLIKIGKADCPESRFQQIQANSPILLERLGILFGYTLLEVQMHELFAPLRVRGEWFAPVDPLLTVMKNALDPWLGAVESRRFAKVRRSSGALAELRRASSARVEKWYNGALGAGNHLDFQDRFGSQSFNDMSDHMTRWNLKREMEDLASRPPCFLGAGI